MGTIPINAPRNACAETRNFRHLKAEYGREPRHFSTHAHSARDNMGIRSENQSFLSIRRRTIPQNLRHNSGSLDHCALFCYNAAALCRSAARKTARFPFAVRSLRILPPGAGFALFADAKLRRSARRRHAPVLQSGSSDNK